jgi:hypothetical protein
VLTEGVVGSRVRIGAWLVAEDRDTAYDGSEETDNPLHERTTIRVPLFTVDVRLTEQLGIQAATTIPDITRTAVVGSFNFKETFSGLGDTSVLGWYRLRPIHRWNIVLNVGTSLPTGKTEQPRFRPELEGGNLVPMSRLQRGTGTVDPLFGVNADGRIRQLTVFGSVAARTPLYENEWGLRTGASWEVNSGVARTLWTHRVVGFGRLGWLHRQQDSFEGTPVLVGGGDWIYLTPGVAVVAGKGLNLQAEVKLPVYRALANRQLDSSAIFQFGFSRAF